MTEEDIFARIDQIIAYGPSVDDIHNVDEVVRQQRDMFAATANTSTSKSITSTSVMTSTKSSFLDNIEIDRYEHDINEITITSPIFATMVPTTFGLNGILTGVSFNENTIIPFIKPHLRFPCIRAVCNFGDIKIPDFDRLVAEHKIDLSTTVKAARARNKKQQRVRTKPRKIQGNGTCFNSSVLFWIYSETHQAVYKIRLFRTGGLGLPGTKPEMIRDILQTIRDIFIPMLHAILSDQNNVTNMPPITLQTLTSIMKNYKWRRILDSGCMIDLQAIKECIQNDSQVPGKIPYGIKYVYYGYSDSKLSVKFHTPTAANTDKTVRINIFLSGKINILGAHDSLVTKNICQYLVSLLSNPQFIILPIIDEEDPDGSATIAASELTINSADEDDIIYSD